MEEFIGAPYVITFDMGNKTAVREAVATALATKVRYIKDDSVTPRLNL